MLQVPLSEFSGITVMLDHRPCGAGATTVSGVGMAPSVSRFVQIRLHHQLWTLMRSERDGTEAGREDPSLPSASQEIGEFGGKDEAATVVLSCVFLIVSFSFSESLILLPYSCLPVEKILDEGGCRIEKTTETGS